MLREEKEVKSKDINCLSIRQEPSLETFINHVLFSVPMTDILVTNDDGYHSAGFIPLVRELLKDYSVVAVAPDRGRSWIGKAITTKTKLELKKIKREGVELYTLSGTPADCVQVGLYDIVDTRPRLVVSGINFGLNIGHARILSSGTIGAAMEAAIDGLPAIAVSLQIPMTMRGKIDFYDAKSYPVFENAAKITVKLIKKINHRRFDDVDLFTVNVPFDATVDTEVAVTTPYKKPYGRLFHRNEGKYLQRTPPVEFTDIQEGTDLQAINEGKISVTPISLSLTPKNSSKHIEDAIKSDW